IDKHVALYRRHGANGYSDMGIYGAATLAVRTSSSSWEEVAKNLRTHVENNLNRFYHQIGRQHIERLLAQTAYVEDIEPIESCQAVEETEPTQSSQACGPIDKLAIRRFSSWMARSRI